VAKLANATSFGVGHKKVGGRKKGSKNKFGAMLKDAILEAATEAGGKEGLVGYLKKQAEENPSPFLSLLGKVLPLQVTGEGGGAVTFTFALDHAGKDD
jgi:hypothetical protein